MLGGDAILRAAARAGKGRSVRHRHRELDDEVLVCPQVHRRWCVGTRRPTMRRRQRGPTSGSARRTGWASGWDKGRPGRWRPHTLKSPPPRFLNLRGQQLGLLCGVTLFLPSRLSRVRSPSPAPPRTRRHNACIAKAAERRSPASEAGSRPGADTCRIASRRRPHLVLRCLLDPTGDCD
jgi:hypothetical protein